MADTTNPAVPEGQHTEASGNGENTQDSNKNVSRETYLKTLDEAKKAKARLREIEEAERKRQEEALAEQGEYKKLLTQREEELKAAKEELASVRAKEQSRRKLASVLNAVDGDIDPKFYGLIDFEDVVINPDTGEVDEMSVAKAVSKIKKTYPEIIRSANGPKLPVDAPKGNAAGTIKRSEWKKLPSAEMKKYKLSQIID